MALVRGSDRRILSNGIEIIELFYAAFSVGAIVIPVTTRSHRTTATYLFGQSALRDRFRRDGTSISDVLPANPDAVRITTGNGVCRAVEYAGLPERGCRSAAGLSIESDDAIIMYTWVRQQTQKEPSLPLPMSYQHYFMNAVELGNISETLSGHDTLAHRTGLARSPIR